METDIINVVYYNSNCFSVVTVILIISPLNSKKSLHVAIFTLFSALIVFLLFEIPSAVFLPFLLRAAWLSNY